MKGIEDLRNSVLGRLDAFGLEQVGDADRDLIAQIRGNCLEVQEIEALEGFAALLNDSEGDPMLFVRLIKEVHREIDVDERDYPGGVDVVAASHIEKLEAHVKSLSATNKELVAKINSQSLVSPEKEDEEVRMSSKGGALGKLKGRYDIVIQENEDLQEKFSATSQENKGLLVALRVANQRVESAENRGRLEERESAEREAQPQQRNIDTLQNQVSTLRSDVEKQTASKRSAMDDYDVLQQRLEESNSLRGSLHAQLELSRQNLLTVENERDEFATKNENAERRAKSAEKQANDQQTEIDALQEVYGTANAGTQKQAKKGMSLEAEMEDALAPTVSSPDATSEPSGNEDLLVEYQALKAKLQLLEGQLKRGEDKNKQLELKRYSTDQTRTSLKRAGLAAITTAAVVSAVFTAGVSLIAVPIVCGVVAALGAVLGVREVVNARKEASPIGAIEGGATNVDEAISALEKSDPPVKEAAPHRDQLVEQGKGAVPTTGR
jgi:DNA repair exonuclease SbcCD ATPase subunit